MNRGRDEESAKRTLPQRALITGASSGIGREIALALGKRGMSLVLLGRDVVALKEVMALVPGSIIHCCDLADERALETVIAAYPAVDLVVNAAGFGLAGRFEATPWQDIRQQLEVNLLALTRLCHHYTKSMLSQGGGTILNIGSSAALSATPGLAVYSASKAFVQALSLSLAAEGKEIVRVKCLIPGPTATDFSRRAGLRLNRGANNPADIADIALRLIDNNSIVEMLGGRLARTKAVAKLLMPAWLVVIFRRTFGTRTATYRHDRPSS